MNDAKLYKKKYPSIFFFEKKMPIYHCLKMYIIQVIFLCSTWYCCALVLAIIYPIKTQFCLPNSNIIYDHSQGGQNQAFLSWAAWYPTKAKVLSYRDVRQQRRQRPNWIDLRPYRQDQPRSSRSAIAFFLASTLFSIIRCLCVMKCSSKEFKIFYTFGIWKPTTGFSLFISCISKCPGLC